MAANDPGQPTLSSDAAALARDGTVDLDVPACALAIGAHPDDIEFGAGGTLAKWAAAGCVVHHLVCTDGSKGTWDVDADTVALVARRQDEQREAARLTAGGRAGRLGARSSGGSTASSPTTSPRAPRSSAPSARCGPTSCSPTTRGSATGCTPITA